MWLLEIRTCRRSLRSLEKPDSMSKSEDRFNNRLSLQIRWAKMNGLISYANL